ncbi:MAG: ribonuclease R [Clostridiales bacterium]|nr:ribonuclease R [Clostridiales bacterium]
MNLQLFIKDNFISGEWKNISLKKIYSLIDAKKPFEQKSVQKILNALENEGVIVFLDGKYTAVEFSGLIKGTLRGNEKGFAFLVPNDGSDDYFIPNRNLHGGLHEDTVLAKKVENSLKGSSDEAEVVKILERGVKILSGTFYRDRGQNLVRPDDKNYFEDVYIEKGKENGAKTGDKVLVKIIGYFKGYSPDGVVTEVLGKRYELFAEENSIIKGSGFEEKFPKTVLDEVAKIPQEVGDNQLIDRLNLTDRLIITIDGDDSRDFDDAVEVEKLKNGNYKLGVHIADVSQYVKTGTALDKEAYNRATSVYFPDRVLPMLPKELSNGICSLNEGVVRLTLSCIMEISPKGEVVDRQIVKSAIKSKRRMTYNKVEAIINGDADVIAQYADVSSMIMLMAELQSVLTAKRDERGSVDLDIKEAHITYQNGEIDIGQREAKRAYKIIEEFMVLANECVAEFAFYQELPILYRIHEKPTVEKAQTFVEFLKALGINVRWRPENARPSDFSAVLDRVKGEPFYSLVNRVMLRSMQKASYYPENLGHFGLSSKCYCHFTSPIRRYPDLIVHRVIKMVLDGQIGQLNDLYGDFIYETATQTSEKERKANEVERAVDDLYKAKYMENFIGQEFDGVISGVTSFGVFTELENTVEGITKLEDLPRGNYSHDPKTFTLSSSKHTYKLGDKVRVGVMGVDLSSRRVEFIILYKLA